VPGLRTDFQRVNWQHLSAPGRQQDLQEAAFRRWLATLPCCTLGGDRRTPADPLNIVLIGSADTVLPPLARRDWHVTQTLSVTSAWRTLVSSLLGRPVSVGQISRDIGVRLTTRTLTTHKIDAEVDETRWYLMQDLFFSESLHSFNFVPGVGVSTWNHPRRNDTGDPYVTDGLRAVLWLSSAPVTYHRVVTRWPRPESDQPLPDPRRTPRP
jgi:LssY C-terminus